MGLICVMWMMSRIPRKFWLQPKSHGTNRLRRDVGERRSGHLRHDCLVHSLDFAYLLKRGELQQFSELDLLASILQLLEHLLGSFVLGSGVPYIQKDDEPCTSHNRISFAATLLECHIRTDSGQARSPNPL